MNVDTLNIKDLRSYAKDNGIKLQSATKKSEILAIVKDSMGSEEAQGETLESLFAEDNEEQHVMTSRNEDARQAREDAEIAERIMNTEIDDRKPTGSDMAVCLYSEKKYSSSSLGKLTIGYNIVKEDLAKIWVRLPDVRLADKEELMRAKEKGIKPGQRIGPKGRRM
jgi:hypothetical protein|tara:strand:+ start:655 stop:1155 length:501 start_codon:yes stop_codon:yes gene_type:complete